MNWLWLLILIPIVVSGIIIAYLVVPRTPVYTHPTTTTTTRTTTRTTTTTETPTLVSTVTSTSTYSPCSLFNGECKLQCAPDEDLVQAPCEPDKIFCCRSRKITTTTTTETTYLTGPEALV